MMLFAWGAMVGYLVIIGDNASRVVANWNGDDDPSAAVRRLSVAVVGVVCVLPLGLVRSLHGLSKASVVSLVAVLWITLVVVGRSLGGHGGATLPQGDAAAVTVASPNLFSAIGIVAFAFVCHHNSFMIFNSLKVRRR